MYYTINHSNSFSSGDCLGNQFLINYNIRSFNTNRVNFIYFLRSLDITPNCLILSETWNNTGAVFVPINSEEVFSWLRGKPTMKFATLKEDCKQKQRTKRNSTFLS